MKPLTPASTPGHVSLENKPYFPERGAKWRTGSPEQFNIDAQKLREAVGFALANEHTGARDLKVALSRWFRREPFHQIAGPTRKRGNPSGMILKQGYAIAQWGPVKRADMALSATKSYLSTIAALALDAKLIRSLDNKVGEYVTDGKFADPHNSKITWAHLLTQSSDWSGELWGGHDWAERPPKTGTMHDWKARKRSEPGERFAYNNVRVNLLAYSLFQVWRKPLEQVLKEKVMDPIGASGTWRWHGYRRSWAHVNGKMMKCESGGGHWGGGLFISTEDHARYALLFLNNGNWNGKQIFSPEWVRMAATPSPANENYGFLWWLNRNPANHVGEKPRHWPGVSEDVFYASGFGGNLVVVDRQNDLVVVTRWLEPSKGGEMIRMVTDALRDSKPYDPTTGRCSLKRRIKRGGGKLQASTQANS